MKYDNYFFVIDTETGGLPSRLKKNATTQVALVELAIVVVDNVKLKIIDKKSWLFKPYAEELIYTEEAAKVSGITKQFAEENGMKMGQAFSEIKNFIGQYKKKNRKHILVGHNIIKFDLEFIVNLFLMNNSDASKYFDDNVCDTLLFSRLKFVEALAFNLSVSCQMSNVTLVDAHRAMSDTISTAKLWISFLSSLRDRYIQASSPKPVTKNTQFKI